MPKQEALDTVLEELPSSFKLWDGESLPKGFS